MGRKKITDLPSHKFSVVLNGKNKEILDIETEAFDMKYSSFINCMIGTFGYMSEDVKNTLNSALIRMCDELNKQIIACEEGFEKQDALHKKEECLNILKIINKGKELDLDVLKPNMTRYVIKNGYAILPSNWIILNEEEAIHSTSVSVVECRNSSKYKIPHFAVFLQEKYKKDYYDEICNLCCQKWKDFDEKVLKKQVDLIPDPERPGSFLNGEAHLQAPTIGIFTIKDSIEKESGQEFPYGAMVVRTNTDIEDN